MSDLVQYDQLIERYEGEFTQFFPQIRYNCTNRKSETTPVLVTPRVASTTTSQEDVMAGNHSIPSISNKQSKKQGKPPKRPDQVLHWFYFRTALLLIVAIVSGTAWNALISVSVDYGFRMTLGGFAVGLLLALALMYRLDWHEVLTEADSRYKFQLELWRELEIRRRVGASVYRGAVYVIQDIDVTGWFKIGKTTNPTERIGHFDTLLPFQVRVVHVIASKDCNSLETMLHRHFAAKRQRGEWFALTNDDIEWIMKLEAV